MCICDRYPNPVCWPIYFVSDETCHFQLTQYFVRSCVAIYMYSGARGLVNRYIEDLTWVLMK